MISKSLSTSRKFAALGDEFSQVLYMLLLAHCDDFGRQSGDAFTVKHQVFPTSPRTEDDFENALQNLEGEPDLIQRYTVAGEQVLQVLGYDRHQVGLHKRTASRFPEYPGGSGKVPEIPSELNLTELNLIEGNSTERNDVVSRPLISGEGRPGTWGKIHGDHAAGFCDWVCLPEFLFSELTRKSMGGAEYVKSWALGVRGEWEGQTVGDGLRFWRARWEESHPTATPSRKPRTRTAAEVIASMEKKGML